MEQFGGADDTSSAVWRIGEVALVSGDNVIGLGRLCAFYEFRVRRIGRSRDCRLGLEMFAIPLQHRDQRSDLVRSEGELRPGQHRRVFVKNIGGEAWSNEPLMDGEDDQGFVSRGAEQTRD